MTVSGIRSLLVALVALAWSAFAAAGEVRVEDAWARATLPGQQVAGVYMTLTSEAEARLVGVESEAARSAEIHEMRHEDGVMKMRRVESLDLPAGLPVKLAPGGFHIMLMNIVRPLQAGQAVSLVLEVEEAGKRRSIPVQAPVRAAGGAGGGHEHH